MFDYSGVRETGGSEDLTSNNTKLNKSGGVVIVFVFPQCWWSVLLPQNDVDRRFVNLICYLQQFDSTQGETLIQISHHLAVKCCFFVVAVEPCFPLQQRI